MPSTAYDLVYRLVKGSPLTAEEVDGNFEKLATAVQDLDATVNDADGVIISDTEPSSSVRAKTLWVTRSGVAKIRNSDNTAWIRVEQPVLYAETTGSSGAYVVTLPVTLTTLSELQGRTFAIKANHSSPSGGSTINVNSLGATPIKQNGTTAIAADNLLSGAIYLLTYDGTNFQLTSSRNVPTNLQLKQFLTYSSTLTNLPANGDAATFTHGFVNGSARVTPFIVQCKVVRFSGGDITFAHEGGASFTVREGDEVDHDTFWSGVRGADNEAFSPNFRIVANDTEIKVVGFYPDSFSWPTKSSVLSPGTDLPTTLTSSEWRIKVYALALNPDYVG